MELSHYLPPLWPTIFYPPCRGGLSPHSPQCMPLEIPVRPLLQALRFIISYHVPHTKWLPSTIPPELCSTSCRPDLVVWSLDTDEIRILELTVCHNSISSIESARKRKQEKQPYSELTSDLEMAGHTVFYDTIEIGSLGHYLKSSMQALASTIPNARRQDLTKLITSLAKTAIGCSATIFHARNSPTWVKSKPLYTPLF